MDEDASAQAREQAREQARSQAWGRYWATGVRHSCPMAFADHYGAATQAFWKRQFGLIRAQDHVLELGCGNGSLIRFMAEHSPCLPHAVDAVDASALDDDWQQALPGDWRARVCIRPKADARRLPLADGSVQHVYSQYAFEYFADDDGVASVWAELARVAAARAHLAMIVHHRHSHLVRVAGNERDHCDWLLQDGGLLALARQALALFAEAATPAGRQRLAGDVQAQALRTRLNGLLDALSARSSGGADADVLDETARTLMSILRLAGSGLEAAQQALLSLHQQLQDNRLRVAELVDAAIDAQQLAQWQQRLRGLGFVRFAAAEIHEADRLFGWGIEASREEA